MAIVYCDIALGTGADDGTSWTDAYRLFQGALTGAGAGGTVYIKTGDGSTTDTASGTRVFTSPGTAIAPVYVYGIKTGISATPPVTDSTDLTSRGDSDSPTIVTTSVGDMRFIGYAVCVGLTFISSNDFEISTGAVLDWLWIDCKINWVFQMRVLNPGQSFRYENCDLAPTNAAAQLLSRFGAEILIDGGLFSGTAVTKLVDGGPSGFIRIRGCDLSTVLASKIVKDFAGSVSAKTQIINCEMPATYTKSTGTPSDHISFLEIMSSDDSSALGSSASVQQYYLENIFGTIEMETTITREASDGASGEFSYAIEPKVSTCTEPFTGVKSPMFVVWNEGDSTAQKIEIFIANDSASTDYVEGEVIAKLWSPSSSGTAQHDYNVNDEMVFLIPAAPAALTNDPGSTWGTGGNNHQVLTFDLSAALSPDFQGPLYCQIEVCEDSATPKICYVDPLPVVTT